MALPPTGRQLIRHNFLLLGAIGLEQCYTQFFFYEIDRADFFAGIRDHVLRSVQIQDEHVSGWHIEHIDHAAKRIAGTIVNNRHSDDLIIIGAAFGQLRAFRFGDKDFGATKRFNSSKIVEAFYFQQNTLVSMMRFLYLGFGNVTVFRFY
jgi:hypothetical protein